MALSRPLRVYIMGVLQRRTHDVGPMGISVYGQSVHQLLLLRTMETVDAKYRPSRNSDDNDCRITSPCSVSGSRSVWERLYCPHLLALGID